MNYGLHYVVSGPWPSVNGAVLALLLLGLGTAVGAAVAAGRQTLLAAALAAFAVAAVASLFLVRMPGGPGEVPPPPGWQAASLVTYLVPYALGLLVIGPAVRRPLGPGR